MVKLDRGTLVRYGETTTRWFLATVVAIEEDEIKIEYMDGTRKGVEPQRVRPFLPELRRRDGVFYISRDKLSLVLWRQTKTKLCDKAVA